MKILAVGDLVGENGLDKLKQVLPKLKRRSTNRFCNSKCRKCCRRDGNYL